MQGGRARAGAKSRDGRFQRVRQRILYNVSWLLYRNPGRRPLTMLGLLRQSSRRSLSSFYRHYRCLEQALRDYLAECQTELEEEIAAIQAQVDEEFRQLGRRPSRRERNDVIEARVLRAGVHLIWRRQNLYWGLHAQFDERLPVLVARLIFPYVTTTWPRARSQHREQQLYLFTGVFVGVVAGWLETTHGDWRSAAICAREVQVLTWEMGHSLRRVGEARYRVKPADAVRPKDAFPLE